MVGETDETWRTTVRKAIELDADCVTIYQMELPFNTIYSREMLASGGPSPVADWPTKRGWVDYAFGELKLNRVELATDEENGRAIRSYEKCGFVREGLLREHRLIEGRPADSVAMAVIRSDWEAR